MRHGFLLIDKPAGKTSHDIVAMVRRALSEQHVGHLGTLDPAATGLLAVAVGRKALKVIELFSGLTKEYDAQVRFGAVSSTYDREGVIEEMKIPMGWVIPEHVQIQRLIADRFVGTISQIPPPFSAVHVGGERAYKMARQGKSFSIPPREVEVSECRILDYDYPHLALHVVCGSGTYIRSLAHDLGQLLRCGGYLEGLRRTAVGSWSLAHAVSPDAMSWSRVLPLKDVLAPLPRRDMTEEECKAIRFGQNIPGTVQPRTIGWHAELPVAILEPTATGETHARKVL